MSKQMKLNLVSLLSLCIFMALAFGSSNKNQSPQSGGSTPAQDATPIEVSASTLLSDYENNEVAADGKYKGKMLVVSGTINNIAKDILDKMYVTLKTSNPILSVQCYFDESNQTALSQLQKGKQVKIKERCDGKFGNVTLKDCVL